MDPRREQLLLGRRIAGRDHPRDTDGGVVLPTGSVSRTPAPSATPALPRLVSTSASRDAITPGRPSDRRDPAASGRRRQRGRRHPRVGVGPRVDRGSTPQVRCGPARNAAVRVSPTPTLQPADRPSVRVSVVFREPDGRRKGLVVSLLSAGPLAWGSCAADPTRCRSWGSPSGVSGAPSRRPRIDGDRPASSDRSGSAFSSSFWGYSPRSRTRCRGSETAGGSRPTTVPRAAQRGATTRTTSRGCPGACAGRGRDDPRTRRRGRATERISVVPNWNRTEER